MLTSTANNTTQRLLVREPIVPRHARYRGLDEPRTVHDGASTPAGLHRRPWLGRLRRALEQELFVLHFQPIVSLRDGLISHHEALLRLADEPDGSLVAPNEFLPAAERYGLIREIDRMVLDRVVAMLGSEGGAGIAINLSALSVTDGAMLPHLQRRLQEHEVDPARLVVEVTETAAISDMASARAFCAGVLALGCSLALDDFGAGFGSFQYLKHLPFSHLKIDGDFIRLLPVSRTDQLVVRALASVVRGMGRETIAEFVGDGATVSLLRSYGVDYAQGFQIGHPSASSPLSRAAGTGGASLHPRRGR
jgi:EAL domain-containing protein (putative c-di-GMP-specific phosphodiesterase class I)